MIPFVSLLNLLSIDFKEMEKLYEDELVSHLASCDLDAGKLKELLSWARVSFSSAFQYFWVTLGTMRDKIDY